MSTSTVHRHRALPVHDRDASPRARARARHLHFGCATLILLAFSLIATSPPAAADEEGPIRTSEKRFTKLVGVPRAVGTPRDRKVVPVIKMSGPVTPAPVDCPTCEPLGEFTPERFREPTSIDNDWMPLTPGIRFEYQGRSNSDGELLDHHVIWTVTDLVKNIGGIPCVVVWIQDIEEGVLTESELAFYAQSDVGDVWNAGEYPEEYENGEFITSESTWIHGVEDARAGVIVEDEPVVGQSHEQANAPALDHLDCGTAFSIQEDGTADQAPFCVPDGCYSSFLTMQEWAPLDACPEILHRVYAKGEGLIQAGPINEPESESLVLMDAPEMTRDEIEEAREAALALDARGLEGNEVYAETEPAYVQEVPEDDVIASPAVNGGAGNRGTSGGRVALSIGTNPFTDGTSLAYGVADAGPVELGIFDVVGRRVRSLVNRSEAPGTYSVRWDGRDDTGSRVERGVYFARLKLETRLVNRTLVMAR